MISIWIILCILFGHWLFDFVLQTESQAINKSISIKALNEHVTIYAICWVVLYPILGFDKTLFFIGITYICHFITDYFTSRLNRKLSTKARVNNKWHNFFVSIGFDQFLHYTQLFLTFYLLNK